MSKEFTAEQLEQIRRDLGSLNEQLNTLATPEREKVVVMGGFCVGLECIGDGDFLVFLEDGECIGSVSKGVYIDTDEEIFCEEIWQYARINEPISPNIKSTDRDDVLRTLVLDYFVNEYAAIKGAK